MDTKTTSITDPKVDYSKEISDWKTYSLFLESLAGLVRTSDGVVSKYVTDPKVYKEVDGSMHAFYDAIQGVDNEFLDGIKNMKAGTAPSYTFEPAPVPDWPDLTTGDAKGIPAILDGVWQTVRPLLETVLEKIKISDNPTKAAFEAAVAGLISSGDKVIAELKKAFL